MSKKSWLEKLKLVESEDNFDQEAVLTSLREQSIQLEEDIPYIPPVEFDLGHDFLTVPKIYEKAELSDFSRSIFKVDEFGKHLPDNLPTDVKRQSVIGILAASGLELDELLEDAEKRINALKGVTNLTTENSEADIMEKEQEITTLLNKVDSLKQSIIDRKSAQEQQNNLINEELDKITQVLKFVSTK